MANEEIIYDYSEERSIYFDIENLIISHKHAVTKELKDILVELIKLEKDMVCDLLEIRQIEVTNALAKARRKAGIKAVK